MKCIACKVDLDRHNERDFEICLRAASSPKKRSPKRRVSR